LLQGPQAFQFRAGDIVSLLDHSIEQHDPMFGTEHVEHPQTARNITQLEQTATEGS